MPIKHIDNEHFVYIGYKRDGFKDFDAFKREMANAASSLAPEKDVVLDLTPSHSITSSEIGAIIRLLKNFDGTQKFLRLIASPEIKKVLNGTNIARLNNLVIYESFQIFLSTLSSPPAKE